MKTFKTGSKVGPRVPMVHLLEFRMRKSGDGDPYYYQVTDDHILLTEMATLKIMKIRDLVRLKPKS